MISFSINMTYLPSTKPKRKEEFQITPHLKTLPHCCAYFVFPCCKVVWTQEIVVYSSCVHCIYVLVVGIWTMVCWLARKILAGWNTLKCLFGLCWASEYTCQNLQKNVRYWRSLLLARNTACVMSSVKAISVLVI